MAFEATKREWGELYAFFRLLADGYVYAGTPEVKKNEAQRLPVAMIQREEHDGTRRYIIESEENIHICGEKIDKLVAREDFSAVAELILSAVKASRENDVMSPDGVEEFWMRWLSLIWKQKRMTVPIFMLLLQCGCAFDGFLCPFSSQLHVSFTGRWTNC